MAMASGLGADVAQLDAAAAFGEDQGRYVVTTRPGLDIPGAAMIGTVGGATLAGVSVSALREANESFFKAWMESDGGLDPSDLSGN